MLGAILATVISLVVTAGLGRSRGLYDPEVTDGAMAELQKALESSPGARVKTL